MDIYQKKKKKFSPWTRRVTIIVHMQEIFGVSFLQLPTSKL